MEQKILDKLKANRTDLEKDVTDRTLISQAKLLATFITTDEALVKLDATAVIKEMQGNISFTTSAAVKLEQDKTPAETPEQIEAAKKLADQKLLDDAETARKAEEAMKAKGGLTIEDLTAAILAANAPLAAELAALKGGNAKTKLIEDAKLAITEKFQLEDSDKAGSDYIFEDISNRDFENLDAFVNEFEGKYNKFRAANGLGVVEPKSSIVIDSNNPDEDEFTKGVREKRKAAQEKIDLANKRVSNQ